MTWIDHAFDNAGNVPEWAAFFSRDEYVAFLAAVSAEMQRRELPHQIEAGTVTVTHPDGQQQKFGLQNLAQICHRDGREQCATAIERHFEVMLHSDIEQEATEAMAQDYDRARALLKVRLYPRDYLRAVGDALVYRELAGDVLQVLVFDLPNTVSTVQASQARGWKRSEDELFALGLDNVKAEGKLPISGVANPQGGAVSALLGDSFFAASHALFLSDYLTPATSYGAIVSMPHRHVVLFHPIVDLSIVSAITRMVTMAHGLYREGPGSISPEIFWWRDGNFMLLPARLSDSKLEFAPPIEFVANVFDKLMGKAP